MQAVRQGCRPIGHPMPVVPTTGPHRRWGAPAERQRLPREVLARRLVQMERFRAGKAKTAAGGMPRQSPLRRVHFRRGRRLESGADADAERSRALRTETGPAATDARPLGDRAGSHLARLLYGPALIEPAVVEPALIEPALIRPALVPGKQCPGNRPSDAQGAAAPER